MKNEDGYTLIEVIVSLLVLATASVMLLSGIKSVIHFMSASNNLKNASDAMYGKAEGIEDEEVTGEVSETTSDKITYKVNELPVEGYVKSFKSELYDDIGLKQLVDQAGKKLNSMDLYNKETIGVTNDFYNYSNDYINGFISDNISFGGISKMDSFKNFENLGFKYPLFSEKLLPNTLRKNDYYIRVNYPWEYGIEAGKPMISGGALIFLSLIETNSFAEVTYGKSTEKINFVYDYMNQIWYYHPDISQGLSYGLQYNRNYINDSSSSNIQVSNGVIIKSWEAFLKHIKDSSNGWLYLDGNTTYDANADPLKYWTPVK